MSKSKKGRRRARAIAHARKLRQAAATADAKSGEQRELLLPQDAPAVKADLVKVHPIGRRTHDPQFSLFHYTTASGLLGIVETKTLWATQANFLNDAAECQLLSKLLTPRIKADFEKIVPELIQRNAFKPEIAKEIGSEAMTSEAER
jgi:hypothetical protein